LESPESIFDNAEEGAGTETFSTLFDLFLSEDDRELWIRVNDKVIDSVGEVIHTIS